MSPGPVKIDSSIPIKAPVAARFDPPDFLVIREGRIRSKQKITKPPTIKK